MFKNIEREIKSNLIFKLLYLLVQLSTVLIVGHLFSPTIAGYYFVLNSYVAISIFFELGVSFVIMQNAAHESSKLIRSDFEAPNFKLNRLSSLFSFTYKWFIISSFLFIVLISVSSPFFFSVKYSNVNWKGPLLILSLGIGLNLVLDGVYAFFEGCRFMYEVSIIRITQTAIFLLLFIILVSLGFELYAYGLSLVISMLVSLIAAVKLKIWKYCKSILNSDKNSDKIKWTKDLLPYQWRFAVSTISGFLVFQLVNLLTFKFNGPILAGKLGLTLSLINGIVTISMVWFNTRAPIFATLVANKEIGKLREIFKNTITICIGSHIVMAIFFALFKFVIIDEYKLIFDGRLLDNFSIILLIINSLLNVIVFGLASFSRSNKNEPFLLNSVVVGIVNAFFAFIFIKYYSLFAFIIFMISCNLIISIPWAYIIYKETLSKFKKLSNVGY